MAAEPCVCPRAATNKISSDESDQNERLPVYLSCGKPTVWNPKDAVTLREKYHIVGVLTGCLPRAPRQNVHLGLPLQLMPEELTLLLEKGFAALVKDKPVSVEQTARRVAEINFLKQVNFQEQQELYKEERRQEMIRQLPNIMEGKRVKRQNAVPPDGGTVCYNEEMLIEEMKIKTMPVTPTPEKHMLVHLYTENPWKNETVGVEADWTYPESSGDKLRYAVFKDMWERGHYLTPGQKFGGDFLAYPGDPSRYHSFYIVICVDYKQELTAVDIISMGRLGSNVRKTVLLASQDVNRQVKYTSVQWTGLA